MSKRNDVLTAKKRGNDAQRVYETRDWVGGFPMLGYGIGDFAILSAIVAVMTKRTAESTLEPVATTPSEIVAILTPFPLTFPVD